MGFNSVAVVLQQDTTHKKHYTQTEHILYVLSLIVFQSTFIVLFLRGAPRSYAG
jgi:hypothetical protein